MLSYLACFLLASAGDNASVLGNIGNSYWHYQVPSTTSSAAMTVVMMTPHQAAESPEAAVTNLFLFLILDLVTIVTTVIFFKCWANLNFLKMYAYLQKEYGLMMSISQVRMFTMTMMMTVSTSPSQAYLMIHNFCVIIIACAMDLTFAFNWVFEEGVAK